MLVERDYGVAFYAGHRDGHDLIVELFRRDGRRGAALALRGEEILIFARDVAALRDEIGSLAHRDQPLGRELRVGEAPAERGVGDGGRFPNSKLPAEWLISMG